MSFCLNCGYVYFCVCVCVCMSVCVCVCVCVYYTACGTEKSTLLFKGLDHSTMQFPILTPLYPSIAMHTR